MRSGVRSPGRPDQQLGRSGAVGYALSAMPPALVVISTFLLPLLASSGPVAKTKDAGWQAPTAAELGDDWRNSDSDRFAVARGDFDGDGKQDVARLMVSPDRKRAAIVVEMSAAGTKVIPLEGAAPDVLGAMGISVVEAGTHDTACGKGYWACEHGEPAVITLKWDGIDYFKFGSANSVFYLPKPGAKFRRVWLSD